MALGALVLAAVAATTVGAATKQPTRDRDPVFSPGGRAIAFVRWYPDGTSRVMVMHRDGRGLRFVTPAQPDQYGLTWSPDGASLAYASGSDIWRVDLATGTPLDLTNDPPADNRQPAWSPDGSWIAYDAFDAPCFRCTRLHLMKPDGSQNHVVPIKGDQARRPTWSPDSTKLALSLSSDVVVDLNGNDVVSGDDLVGGVGGAFLTFSPSGADLAWTTGGLVRYTIATQKRVALNSAMKQYPMWSRDGREIAGTGFRGRLLIASAATGKTIAEIKTAATLGDAPSWGAGNHVAYVHTGLCGIDSAWGNGTHRHRLTRSC